MRVYGSIQTQYWTHPNIQYRSDQAKLLGTYLLSSSHTNMMGCFRIPSGYIAEDLRWNLKKVELALVELEKINFLARDEFSDWVMIHRFLKYHPIENPNQGRSIANLFEETPKNLGFMMNLIGELLKQQKHLGDDFIKSLETLSKQFPNQEQDKEQKQEKILMSGKPDVDPLKNVIGFDKPTVSTTLLKSQATEVLNFLNEKTGRAYRPVETNLKLIMSRLKSGATVMNCRQVIAKKTREWKGDEKMSEYLRPATLFNSTKFEQYIGELVIPTEKDEAHGLK
jgi:uncharacterized phage protein (TIGR02220 family)